MKKSKKNIIKQMKIRIKRLKEQIKDNEILLKKSKKQ